MGFDLTPEIMSNVFFKNNTTVNFMPFLTKLETNGYILTEAFPLNSCVTNMDNMYKGYQTKDLGTPQCGESVISMNNAYYGANVSGVPVIGDNVKYMDYAFASTNITEAKCGPNVVSMNNAYRECANITSAEVGDNVVDMAGAYAFCTNLTTAVCGPNVTDMNKAYQGCTNITKAVFGDNVTNFEGAYDGCTNLTEIGVCKTMKDTNFHSVYDTLDLSKVTKMSGNCLWSEDAGTGQRAPLNHYFSSQFLSSTGINIFNITDMPEEPVSAVNGNAISIMNGLFDGGWPYDTGWCWDNCTNMSYAFTPYTSWQGSPFVNITTAVCGPNVIDMSNAYKNCQNLTTAVCGPNVTTMASTYGNCQNLTTAVCGPNVIDMSNAYFNCKKITTPVIGEKVECIARTYVNTGISFKSYCDFINAIPDAHYKKLGGVYHGHNSVKFKYSDIRDISELTTMYNYFAFSGLDETVARCGPNVTDMNSAYSYCNIATAVCGPNVTKMTSTYMSCKNITTAVVGPNVTDMAHAYQLCSNLTTAACGPNVTNMEYAYQSCGNLTTAVVGPNVINMEYAYSSCRSLKAIQSYQCKTLDEFKVKFPDCEINWSNITTYTYLGE